MPLTINGGNMDDKALVAGTFEFVLHRRVLLGYPRAETPIAYIAMGFDDDLSNVTRSALRNTIDFLVAEKGMTRDDTYMPVGVTGAVEIIELVDCNEGLHIVLPRSLYTSR